MGKVLPEGGRDRASLKEFALVSCLLIVLLTIFFYDIFFLGKTLRVSNTYPAALPSGHFDYPPSSPYMGVYDNTPAILEEPYQKFKETSLSRGVFPLWNPHQAGGYPFLATLESSLLFLPEVVLYVVPSPYDWDAYLIFRLLLAGLFTYGFMRVLGFGRLPSFAAGVSYMFSGPVLSWVTNVTLNSDILIPLFLLLIEFILRFNRKRYVILLSLVIFQVVAGGHPEHTFFAILTGIVYLVFRIMTKSYTYELKGVMRNFAISFICGIGLSSVLLIPFAEYVFFQSWHVHGLNVGTVHDGLEKAITILFPWYYSNKLGAYSDWSYNTWPGGWIGFLGIWLTVFTFSAKDKDKNRTRYIFILLFCFYLLKVYGFFLVNWVGYLPLFNLVKFSLHSTQNISFAVAVLCGMAVSYLSAGRDNAKRFLLSSVPVVLITLVALRLYPPSNYFWTIFSFPVGILLVLSLFSFLCLKSLLSNRVLSWLTVILLFAELFVLIPRERSERAETYKPPPYIEFLEKDPTLFRVYGIKKCLSPNTATAFGLYDIGIYEGLFVKRFTDYIRELVDSNSFNEGSFHAFRSHITNPASRFLDLLNLKYLIVPGSIFLSSEEMSQFSLRPVYIGEVIIYERLNVFPRVMIRYEADVAPEGEKSLDILKSGYDVGARVLLDRLPSDAPSDKMDPPQKSDIRTVDYDINHKTFMVNTDRAGFLVVNDVNYPGWRVSVDGRSKDLLTANYLFQAVSVPAGKHVVKFEFCPVSFQIGILLSILSLGFLLFFGLFWSAPKRIKCGNLFL